MMKKDGWKFRKFNLVINSHLVVVCLLFIFTACLFKPLVTKGNIPVPGDLLVSFFFPWFSGGWDGYNSWTTHKEFLGSDAIRQMIPWRYLAITMLKDGQIPVWNPYNFSGTPLLANLQSAVFYPVNVLFFLFSFVDAWTIYIVIQPALLTYFTYLYLKNLNLSWGAALISAISLASSSYVLGWLEVGVVMHSYLWLPLLLLATDKLTCKFSVRWWFVLLGASVCSILSGHSQSFVNIFLFTSLYWLYKGLYVFPVYMAVNRQLGNRTSLTSQSREKLKQQTWVSIINKTVTNKLKSIFKQILLIALWLVTTFGLTSFVLLPAVELKALSPMVKDFDYKIFVEKPTPWINVLTIIAPDILGHPGTYNFSSDIYGDGTPYMGVFVLIFATFGVLFARNRLVKFFILVSFGYWMYVFPGPVYELVKTFKIPVFSETLAARSTFIPVFLTTLISAIGLDMLIKKAQDNNIRKNFEKVLVFFLPIYFGGWLLAWYLSTQSSLHTAFTTAWRNLTLPALMFGVLAGSYVLCLKWFRFNIIFILVLFVTVSGFAMFQAEKTLPFAPKKFFYPNHNLLQELKSRAGVNRYAGSGSAQLDKNMSSYFQLFSPEGYDSLRIDRYAQFFDSYSQGSLPSVYSKSDAQLSPPTNQNRRKLLNILGVKYMLDKDDEADISPDNNSNNFPYDNVLLEWQQGKFIIQRRTDTLPRAYLLASYRIETKPEKIIETFYDPNFDISSSVILEKPISDSYFLKKPSVSNVEFIDYQANKVTIATSADTDTLLFLSDTYYPGWQATIDGQPVEILRANFAFRAVPLSKGNHVVIFDYLPNSFRYGLIITVITLIGLIVLLSYRSIIDYHAKI